MPSWKPIFLNRETAPPDVIREAPAGQKLPSGAMVELTVDGEKVAAPAGTSLYDVIIGMGQTIPSMCYHYTFAPFGSCGVCLVEVEGKKAPVRSCTAAITPGMVVNTQPPHIRNARKKAVEKHLSTHPLDCPVCDADGFCELQDFAYEFGINSVPNVKQKGLPEDTRSIVLDFNMNRCILCAECINICKEVQLVDALQFLKKDGVTHVVAKGDTALHCEFCGDCLAVCTVGAITNKFSKYAYKPWQLKTTITTCAYCGDGCELYLETLGQKVVRVRSSLTWKKKWGEQEKTLRGHGGTCGRGRFGFQYINSPERLSRPLMKIDGRLQEVSWFEALGAVARRFAEIKSHHGGGAIGGWITARCTNEEIYLFQKFMRMALDTNHIDSSARYGHQNFVAAMRDAAGVGRSIVPYEEIATAQAILILGSDITETNPVAALRVKEALRLREAKVIVAEPRATKMARLAAMHLPVRAGAEGLLARALVQSVLAQGLDDPGFRERHPEAHRALAAAAGALSGDQIAAQTGLSIEKINEAAAIFAKAERAVILLAEGIVRRPSGYEDVLALVDLALATGKLERPGCGLTVMCEENNEQGAIDFGATPDLLPGQLAVADPAARARFEAAWGETIPTRPGLALPDLLEAARRGEIKALYLVGENPVGTLPESAGAREAIERTGFVVCQDLFLTETGRLADVVLPASSFAEKAGSFTNLEGRINTVRQAIEPVGESRPDWQIFSEIAGTMGLPLEYGGADELRHEIARILPALLPKTPVRPAPNPAAYLSKDYAASVASRYSMDTPAADPDYPFQLMIGQILYHSGKLSTHAEGLTRIYSKNLLRIHPDDAGTLGIAGGPVRLRAPNGTSVVVGTEPDDSVPRGLVFFPEHFNEPPVKDLVAVTVHPKTRVPVFRLGPVSVERMP